MFDDISSTSGNRPIVPCKYGRTFENGDTVIAAFDLVCEDAWKPPLAVTMYMIGMGLAAFTGKVSDRFGRRPVFLIFTFAQFAVTGLTGFAWNFASYTFLVLVLGLSGLVNYVAAFVLVTETIGVKRQTAMAIFYPGAYACGITVSPVLGYLVPYWRWFLWSSALLGILYIPLFWLCPESLRWSLVSGNEEKAKALLKKIANTNGKDIDAEKIYRDFHEAKAENEKLTQIRSRREGIELRKEASFFHLLRNRTMLIRSSVLYLGWCITSMLYFAITLNPSTLSGNRLFNVFLSGLVEVPAFGLSYCLIRVIGRVRASVIFYCVAGISCCIAPFLSGVATTTLVLIGKGSITAVFNIVYLVVVEITPTLVRTTSMGVASASARLGAIIMPYLMFAGQTVNHAMPFLVMGGLALFTGLLTTFLIPETKGVPMPDTVRDAVGNKRLYGLNMCKKFQTEHRKEEASMPLNLST